jgi:hypothetical protein
MTSTESSAPSPSRRSAITQGARPAAAASERRQMSPPTMQMPVRTAPTTASAIAAGPARAPAAATAAATSASRPAYSTDA